MLTKLFIFLRTFSRIIQNKRNTNRILPAYYKMFVITLTLRYAIYPVYLPLLIFLPPKRRAPTFMKNPILFLASPYIVKSESNSLLWLSIIYSRYTSSRISRIILQLTLTNTNLFASLIQST